METNTKAAMVAAVSEALKFKHQNPSAKDDDVIGYVVKISDQIIRRMST